MKISIIIPTFKPQDYLYECLDSLYDQTFDHNEFEVLLILNGEFFPYKKEIEQYLQTKLFSNVILYTTKIAGVSHARNIGIEHAKGEYIGFIDDDDLVSPEYLEELYSLASESTIPLCRPIAFKEKDINNKPIPLPYRITSTYNKLSPKGCIPFYQARKFFSGPCMKLIHREIINGFRYNDSLSNGEDSLFMFEISCNYHRVNFTSDKAIYYRRYRSGSATTKNRSFTQKLKNATHIIINESKLAILTTNKYNKWFYATRVLGAIRGIFTKPTI